MVKPKYLPPSPSFLSSHAASEPSTLRFRSLFSLISGTQLKLHLSHFSDSLNHASLSLSLTQSLCAALLSLILRRSRSLFVHQSSNHKINLFLSISAISLSQPSHRPQTHGWSFK